MNVKRPIRFLIGCGALLMTAIVGGAALTAFQLHDLACTRFRRHRVRCFHGTGGASWRGGSQPAYQSLITDVLQAPPPSHLDRNTLIHETIRWVRKVVFQKFPQ